MCVEEGTHFFFCDETWERDREGRWGEALEGVVTENRAYFYVSIYTYIYKLYYILICYIYYIITYVIYIHHIFIQHIQRKQLTFIRMNTSIIR